MSSEVAEQSVPAEAPDLGIVRESSSARKTDQLEASGWIARRSPDALRLQ